MNTNNDPVPGAPGEQEPLGELFGAVFDLAGQAVSRLSPEEVNARLRRIVRKAGRSASTSPPGKSRKMAGPSPRSNCPPARQDAAQGSLILAFPPRSPQSHPARPEHPPIHRPAADSPDAPILPPAASLAPEQSRPAGNKRATPGGALVALASHARPRASDTEAPGHQESMAPVAGGDAVAAIVADVTLESVSADWDADRAVTEIYTTYYRSLVRLAALLVRDVATAEEVVQDSFVAMHGAWNRLRDTEKALSYLRQSVVNRARSVLRHRAVVDSNAPEPGPDMPSAEHGAIALLERSALIAALRDLPPRQREALVLKYYADLSEAQIASAMGISKGAVKSHTAKAMTTLRNILEQEA
jgi:RNA polymerase sigma-70 factor (sigma-E family)